MSSLWTVIFLVLHAYSGAVVPGCENCGCCIGGHCGFKERHGYNVSVYCTHGCHPGIGGQRCYNRCPIGCAICKQITRTKCTTCQDGWYFDVRERCIPCPVRCMKCTSPTKCQECIPPYFNNNSTSDCSLACPGNCFCSTIGTCSACKQGYCNISSHCRDVCPESCKIYGHDLECESRNGKCLKCSEGLFGNYCTQKCNEGCLMKRCHKHSGYCIGGCKTGFKGPACQEINGTNIGKLLGIASTVLTIVSLSVICVIGIIRRWMKNQIQQKEPRNSVSDVRTRCQLLSTENDINVDCNNSSVVQPIYESL